MADPLSKLKLITLRKQRPYIIDNIAKFSYNKSRNIIVYTTCFGDFASFHKPWDIYVLVFNTKKMAQIKKYVNKNYETLLPLFCVVNPDYLLITRAVSTQIYEMAKSCNAAAIGGLYMKEMGGVLSDSHTLHIDRTLIAIQKK